MLAKINQKNITPSFLRRKDSLTSQENEQRKSIGVVKRSTFRCIHDTKFYTINIKDNQKVSTYNYSTHNPKLGNFELNSEFVKEVKRLVVCNNGYNRRIDLNFFVHEMKRMYYRRFRSAIPTTDNARKYEDVKVEQFVRSEYYKYHRIGETAYRHEFEEKFPRNFVHQEKAVYTFMGDKNRPCFKNLQSQEKTRLCFIKKNIDVFNVVVKFLNEMTCFNIHTYMHMGTLSTNKRRLILTDKFINRINSDFRKHGFKQWSEDTIRQYLPTILRLATRGVICRIKDFMYAIMMFGYDFNKTPRENNKNINICRSAKRRISYKMFGVNIFKGEHPVFDTFQLILKLPNAFKDGFITTVSHPKILKEIHITPEEMCRIPKQRELKGRKGVKSHILMSIYKVNS